MRRTITKSNIKGGILNKINIFERKVQETKKKKEKERAIEQKKQENRKSIYRRMNEKNNNIKVPSDNNEKIGENTTENLEKSEKKEIKENSEKDVKKNNKCLTLEKIKNNELSIINTNKTEKPKKEIKENKQILSIERIKNNEFSVIPEIRRFDNSNISINSGTSKIYITNSKCLQKCNKTNEYNFTPVKKQLKNEKIKLYEIKSFNNQINGVKKTSYNDIRINDKKKEICVFSDKQKYINNKIKSFEIKNYDYQITGIEKFKNGIIHVFLLDKNEQIIEQNIIEKPELYVNLLKTLKHDIKNLPKERKNFLLFYPLIDNNNKISIKLIDNNEAYKSIKDILIISEIKESEFDKEKLTYILDEKYNCCICLKIIKEENPLFCYKCQKIIHKDCLKNWEEKCKSDKTEFSCPYCRHELPLEKWETKLGHIDNIRDAEKLNELEINNAIIKIINIVKEKKLNILKNNIIEQNKILNIFDNIINKINEIKTLEDDGYIKEQEFENLIKYIKENKIK